MAKSAQPPDEAQLVILGEAKARFAQQLLRRPQVHGVGIGYKMRRNKRTRDLAIVVHVSHKLPPDQLTARSMVPPTLRFRSERTGQEVEIPTDVRERIPPTPEVACGTCTENLEARARPVAGGYSIGLVGAPGGTIGGWLWDNVTGQLVFISNEHVLGTAADALVIQPSANDGGVSPADNFGRVLRSGPLDVAVARPIVVDDVNATIECSTPGVYETTDATLGMVVEKVGQTTRLTCGIVDVIDYDSGHHGSHNDIWISGDGNNFSEGGDSGSLYVEKTPPTGQSWKRVVGIHWGGGGDDGVGHPILPVMTDLNLTTVCAGLVAAFLESIHWRTSQTHLERDPARPRRLEKLGLARDIERRLAESPGGRTLVELMHDNRVDVVRVLLDGDGRRAVHAALAPVLDTAVTTDEVFAHTIDADDIANVRRAIDVAIRVAPGLANVVKSLARLADASEGLTVAASVSKEIDGLSTAASRTALRAR